MSQRSMEVMFGSEYKLNGGQDHAIYYCPKCQRSNEAEGKERKLYVNLETGGFDCKKCGYEGYVKASRLTINVKGREVSCMDELRCERVSYGSPGWDYLTKVRGLTPDDLEYYDFYDSGDVTFSGGLIVPMRDESYKGFQVRIYDRAASWRWQHLHADVRWWNCKGFSRRDTIWNYGHVNRERPVIATESVFSGIASGKNTIGTLGKDWSPDQLLRIYRLGAPIVILLDGGLPELLLSHEYAERLWCMGRRVSVVELPFGIDPDELNKQDPAELSKLISDPKPYSKYRHWQLKSVCARLQQQYTVATAPL